MAKGGIPESFEIVSAAGREPGYRCAPSRDAAWRFRRKRWIGILLAATGLAFALIFGFAIANASNRSEDLDWGALVLGLPVVGISVTVLYVGVARSVNLLTVSLDTTAIRVTHRPLPWAGLVIRRTRGLSAHADGPILRDDWQGDAWCVSIVDPGRTVTRVLGELSEEEAKYLARELQEALAHGPD